MSHCYNEDSDLLDVHIYNFAKHHIVNGMRLVIVISSYM